MVKLIYKDKEYRNKNLIVAKRITEYIDTPKGGGVSAQKQLRQLVERYPYYQAARILLLRTLFEAHDPTFGQELRRAALYVPSRRVLYQLIEGKTSKPALDSRVHHRVNETADDDNTQDRTYSLIDNFLSTNVESQPKKSRTRYTVDATTDYMGYLLQLEEDMADEEQPKGIATMSGQPVIDTFLENGKFTIQEHPEEELQKPEIDGSPAAKGEIFTETLARIYIKQGKYDKALEIIQRLSLKYPKKKSLLCRPNTLFG